MEMHPIPISGGSVMAQSANWTLREATATDVSNGDAVVAGNLIMEHKTNGTKHEFEAAD